MGWTTGKLKAYRLERTARGLCLYCAAKATRGRSCEVCAEKMNERCKKRYREMRLDGICVSCYGATMGTARCTACGLIDAARQRKTENLTRTKKAKRMKILKARGKR